jgi:hypothetical protein
MTATARKLAILVYRALKGHIVYHDPGADAYALQQRTRMLRRLHRRTATLGFDSSTATPVKYYPLAPSRLSSYLGAV